MLVKATESEMQATMICRMMIAVHTVRFPRSGRWQTSAGRNRGILRANYQGTLVIPQGVVPISTDLLADHRCRTRAVGRRDRTPSIGKSPSCHSLARALS